MMKLGIGQIRSINKKKSLKVNYYLSKQCLRGMLILFHNLIEKQNADFKTKISISKFMIIIYCLIVMLGKLCDIDLLKQFLCYLAFCTKSIKQIVDLKKKYLNKRYFTRDIVVLGGPVFDWKLGKSICASSYVFPSVTLKQCPSTVSLLCHFLLFHVLTNKFFFGKRRVWSI